MFNLSSDFQITPLFHYIWEKSKEAGLYPDFASGKETIQLFIDHDILEDRAIRVGAIQYEGSNSSEREPHLVNWRFERRVLPEELRKDLESITLFRRDKNTGPNINTSAQSIAFKFEELNEATKEAVENIVNVLMRHLKK